ncbi:MAG: hypothetical protein KC910_19155 [Candidatus Eremiobacteraeota bacterium]|nr:hypothetical protein [Candidatus Eremiobacteraeota bacterium]
MRPQLDASARKLRFWRRLVMRACLYSFGLAVVGLELLAIGCLLGSPLPDRLEPADGRWVSFQSLNPEVQALLRLRVSHPSAVAFQLGRPLCPDWARYVPWGIVLYATVDEATLWDLYASHSQLRYAAQPWEVRLEDALLMSWAPECREPDLRWLLREGGVSPVRYRQVLATLRADQRTRAEQVEALRRQVGYHWPAERY